MTKAKACPTPAPIKKKHIKVSLTAHARIKQKAAKHHLTMEDYLEELSKKDIT